MDKRISRASRILSLAFALVGIASASQALAGYVQGAFNSPFTTVSSIAATYTSAQSATDLNVVVISWEQSTGSVQSISDSKGNTYAVAVGPTVNAGNATQFIYYAKNIVGAAAGANTVTVTFSGALPHPDLRIAEYSGVDTNNPLDVAVGASGSSATTSSGSVTTTNANDLLVGSNVVANTTTGPGAGYTQRLMTSHADILEDETVNSTGIYSATAPQNPSGWYVMQMAAFRAVGGGTGGSPYPQSAILKSISWDEATKKRYATGSQCTQNCLANPGSDIWDSAWASDGNIYSVWGDGSGFNSTNQQYEIGVSSLAGLPSSITGADDYYGVTKGFTCSTTPPPTVGGKPGGVVALPTTTMYLFHTTQDVKIGGVCNANAWLARSTNVGASMTFTDHVGSGGGLQWPDASGFIPAAVLQYGSGQVGALAPDSMGIHYIYIYGNNAAHKGSSYLARVAASPANSIETLTNWSYFGGLDTSGNPTWVSSSASATPVWADSNNAQSLLVTFDAAIGRYIAYNDHGTGAGGTPPVAAMRQVSLFDAPSPWGPWTTFDYEENFDNPPNCTTNCLGDGEAVGFSMMQKWFGSDGLSMWPIYSSTGVWDSLNVIKGTMTLETGSTVTSLSVATNAPAVLDTLSLSNPGNLEYIDRTYRLTSVPAAYIGKEQIRLANNDKSFSSSTTYISFTNTVGQNACVAWDHNVALPPWIDGTWFNTGNSLIGNATFNVYSKFFAAGPVSLKGPSAGDMYILFVGC
jgi:hypothetical protein